MRKQSIDSKVAKQTKEENERIEAFRRLISLIQSKIYNPLMQIVDSFNRNTANGKLKLSNIEINDEEETFSFQYTVEPLSEDEDEREISFCFMTTPIEETQPLRVIAREVFRGRVAVGISESAYGRSRIGCRGQYRGSLA